MDKLIEVLKLAKPETDTSNFLRAKDLYGEGIIDSLDVLTIVGEINEVFGIEIGGADFGRTDFMTVESIYELVKRCEEKHI